MSPDDLKEHLDKLSHVARTAGYSMALADIVNYAIAQVTANPHRLISADRLVDHLKELQEGRDVRVGRS